MSAFITTLVCMCIAGGIGWSVGRVNAPAVVLDRYRAGFKAGWMACHKSTMQLAAAHDFNQIETQAAKMTPPIGGIKS